MPVIEKTTFKFLKTLRKNNNREWMQENHDWYLASKVNFTDFVQALIHSINKFDKFGYIDAKYCLYRLNRDLRFSPDKTPYNYHFSAMMGKDGRKGTGAAYYFRIKPGGQSVIAAGSACVPDAKSLENMRTAIDKHGHEFSKIIQSKAFTNTFQKLKSESYKRVPKPFLKDHAYADLLKMKYYWADCFVTDKEIVQPNLLTRALATYKKAYPLVNFVNNHINVKN